MNLAHVVNPVHAAVESALQVAQPITFESMRAARSMARLDGVDVTLLCTAYPEDAAALPGDFAKLPDLERSVLDVARFQVPRKLPLIGDIIARAVAVPGWDCLVYTNVDIGVMPYFYSGVARYVRNGVDAFTVTRRTLPSTWTDPADLPKIYSEIGKPHPGYDCFVVSRACAESLVLDEVCVGAPLVGRAMLINMICHAKRFEVFAREHLTFHLGDDRAWAAGRFDDYVDHNLRACSKVIDGLRARGRLVAHPVIAEFERNSRNRAYWIGGGVSLRNEILKGVGRLLRVEPQA